MSRTRFTACLVTFNEEHNLPDALRSVAFADEIIVVDSHSVDATREIAREFRGRSLAGEEVRPRVIERDWPGHVEQKTFAVEVASHDWVLCVDADERVSAALRLEVETRLAGGAPRAVAYSMPRRTRYLGRWLRWGGWYPDRKVRLFDRRRARWGGVNPHDHVQVDGKVERLRGDLEHHSYRDMAHHVQTINSFTDIAAGEKYERGTRWPLLRMLLHPPAKFLKSYFLKQGFREGAAGLLIAGFGALYVFLKYAKLWELREREWKEAELEGSPPGVEP